MLIWESPTNKKRTENLSKAKATHRPISFLYYWSTKEGLAVNPSSQLTAAHGATPLIPRVGLKYKT